MRHLFIWSAWLSMAYIQYRMLFTDRPLTDGLISAPITFCILYLVQKEYFDSKKAGNRSASNASR